MKATEDKEVIKALELTKAFTVLNDNNTDTASEEFLKIAKKLFEEYQIAKGDARYDFEEVEFYLYTENHKDNNHVYPRICKAGEWFVHYSGVDLTFQTLKEYNKITQCGGILIRRIKKVGKASIGGPLRCLMELFNGQDNPILIKKERESVEPNTTPRIGIKNNDIQDKRLYRFVIDTEPEIDSYLPQYTKDGIVLKDKKYKYNPQYEQ